jgi:hypothetical protein
MKIFIFLLITALLPLCGHAQLESDYVYFDASFMRACTNGFPEIDDKEIEARDYDFGDTVSVAKCEQILALSFARSAALRQGDGNIVSEEARGILRSDRKNWIYTDKGTILVEFTETKWRLYFNEQPLSDSFAAREPMRMIVITDKVKEIIGGLH